MPFPREKVVNHHMANQLCRLSAANGVGRHAMKKTGNICFGDLVSVEHVVVEVIYLIREQ